MSDTAAEPMTVDVLIVGAGPAGAAAALHLARAGRDVLVIDKARFPRDKCCGDGLTTLALRELEALGIEPSMVPNWYTVDAAWLVAPSGREVRVPLPVPGVFAATAPRRELDAALVDLVRAASVKVADGHALTAVERSGGGLTCTVEGIGSIVATTVVAADGMWSPTRRMLGVTPNGYLGEWHAFRQYASVSGPAAERMYVWFEPDLLPGYAWSFPLPGGRANIGFGVLRGGARRVRDMAELWRTLLHRPHIAQALGSFELEGRHSAWPIPARIDRSTLAADGVLYCGDAAMATDVMTGEGIGQALLTGRLAAEAIVAGGTAGSIGRRYRRAVLAELRADHRMSAVLGRALSHRRGAEAAVRLVGASGWGARQFGRWMFEDEPRAIAFTPHRWHRHLFRRPGPFGD